MPINKGVRRMLVAIAFLTLLGQGCMPSGSQVSTRTIGSHEIYRLALRVIVEDSLVRWRFNSDSLLQLRVYDTAMCPYATPSEVEGVSSIIQAVGWGDCYPASTVTGIRSRCVKHFDSAASNLSTSESWKIFAVLNGIDSTWFPQYYFVWISLYDNVYELDPYQSIRIDGGVDCLVVMDRCGAVRKVFAGVLER
jgi:hypothetical protein